MENIFSFCDELGPAKIIHVHEPSRNLKGVLVVDNIAAGPSIGGLRMAPDVGVEECARLARAMTLKNASAGLPHGGGKSVLVGDPKMDRKQKEELIRCFAHALRNETDYIFGPDMGTNEECMAWIKDEIGRSVGLPSEIGGIPLDVIGATGWGLSHAVEVAMEFCDFQLRGARVAIQGFGAVGMHAARFLGHQGTILTAAADSAGTLSDPDGLDIEALIDLKKQGKSVIDAPFGTKAGCEAIIDIECEIWIPAARPDVIHADNVHRLKAKLIPQGANIPFTPEAEKYLHAHSTLVIPDFIANAGGVICAAVEYRGEGQSAAMQ
ncbi:MAG: Glu/Leu/Phe/Val dehydrogenase, partial [Desulfobulbaceae bacterium]|nr:Glu/Leu/Phe/Val dehydrogenase [Desulfobulbaceae bacterium]